MAITVVPITVVPDNSCADTSCDNTRCADISCDDISCTRIGSLNPLDVSLTEIYLDHLGRSRTLRRGTTIKKLLLNL